MMCVVIALIALPLLLYVPFIQDALFPYALGKVSEAIGMEISAGKVRLSWPLRLSVEQLMVVPAPGDTMVTAEAIALQVEPLPLFALDVRVAGDLAGVRYRMGTPDSLMYLQAVVDRFSLNPSNYNLKKEHINVSNALVDGADILLLYNDTDTTATPADTTVQHLTIDAEKIVMRNVHYRMAMLPTIDSLGVDLPETELTSGHIDLAAHTVHAAMLRVDSVSATYLTPTAEYLAAHHATPDVAATDTSSPSQPWTVTADSLQLSGRSALYAVRGAAPAPGFDVNYIHATDIDLRVDSFYNCGTTVTVPLKTIRATERCGIKLDGSGTFAMDSTAMYARTFNLSTIFSTLSLDAMLGIGDLTTDTSLPLMLKAAAELGTPDISLAMPDMKSLVAVLPQSRNISLAADLYGTIGSLNIKTLSAAMRDYFTLSASGTAKNVLDTDRMRAHIDLDGRLPNVQFAKQLALSPAMAKSVNIPPIELDGTVDINGSTIDGELYAAVAESGDVLLKAMWNGRATDYDVDLAMNTFPVNSIMPGLGVGNVTAALSANGHGVDFTALATRLKADAEVSEIVFNSKSYSDFTLRATLDSGNVNVNLLSLNSDASFDLDVTGTITPHVYTLNFDGDINNLDLQALGMSPTQNAGTLSLEGSARIVPDSAVYVADMSINGLDWTLPDMEIYTPGININLNANDSATAVTLRNMELNADLNACCSLDTLIARLSEASTLASAMIDRRRVAVDTLQRALPPFMLTLDAASGNNILASVLSASDVTVKNLNMSVTNDSLITFNVAASGINTGSQRIDNVSLSAMQHGAYLLYRATMNNNPGTFDDFANVLLSGYINYNGLSAYVDQKNIKGETGFKFGASVVQSDSVATVRLMPLNPVISYKEWSLNLDNYLSFDFADNHLDANLCLESTQGGHLDIYTRHDSLTVSHSQEDVIISASGIELADWMSLSPFAPPVSGVASADMSVSWDAESRSITGQGTVSLDNFTYGGEKVGSFLLDLGVTTNTDGVVRANTSLIVDGEKVITAVGVLNDSTKQHPFDLDFSMIHMPLRILNPFLPTGVASLEGVLNGDMCITGTPAAPLFDGFVSFDSTAVKVDMVGSKFTFSNEKIPVDSNVVRFNHYSIKGQNDNPLYVDGTVDMRNIISPNIDLKLSARNMQAVGSQRSSGSDVYGKAFVDVDATVKGNLDFMNVKSTLTLLPGSNVTYVMGLVGNDLSSLTTTDDNMVRFVQFADTTAIARADTVATTGMAMLLDLKLVIDDGTTFGVDISPNGSNRAQVQGSGTLNFSMSPLSDMRLSGRYTIEKGFVRYTPPLMSEKLFNFVSGSYVAFNGDMMNPILNVSATDVLKANVSEEGQNSRLVNFIVGLDVTGTMTDMDVVFDLSTDDDLTISNELQSMTQSQRANQAMNMLLYNVYTGPGTKSNSDLVSNQLFSFLTARLNTWAASAIHGVDVSFGIDRYDSSTDGTSSTAMSYSYKVSKSLFNDRIKIVVGGNYSTDADTDENFSQNLINDISFEYLLNSTGTMYVRLFRHVGYESILEGEVTQTGAGFVFKRRLRTLRDLNPLRRRKSSAGDAAPAAANAVPAASEQSSNANNGNE